MLKRRASPAPWSPAPATSSWATRPPAATAGRSRSPRSTPPPARPRLHFAPQRAVSTSGDAERFVEIDGKRYSHIVDPRTGLGVVDRCSVTVVAPDGATADALATAVYVLGPDRGLALVEATPGASALIVRLRRRPSAGAYDPRLPRPTAPPRLPAPETP